MRLFTRDYCSCKPKKNAKNSFFFINIHKFWLCVCFLHNNILFSIYTWNYLIQLERSIAGKYICDSFFVHVLVVFDHKYNYIRYILSYLITWLSLKTKEKKEQQFFVHVLICLIQLSARYLDKIKQTPHKPQASRLICYKKT
jgi:hypothetical protein